MRTLLHKGLSLPLCVDKFFCPLGKENLLQFCFRAQIYEEILPHMIEISANENGQLSFGSPIRTSPEAALLSLASRKEDSLSPSAQFWSNFAKHFIESVRLNPAVEELREQCRITLTPDKMREFLAEAPFMRGGEYLNEDYLAFQWDNLQNHFLGELKFFPGSVEEYLLGLNPEIHLVGRVFFHLVENKQDPEFPFAFMATYLANVQERGNPTHRPLKYALNEYQDNQEKMLLLLSTITRASETSLFNQRPLLFRCHL